MFFLLTNIGLKVCRPVCFRLPWNVLLLCDR